MKPITNGRLRYLREQGMRVTDQQSVQLTSPNEFIANYVRLALQRLARSLYQHPVRQFLGMCDDWDERRALIANHSHFDHFSCLSA
jgi:hypothetical protein